MVADVRPDTAVVGSVVRPDALLVTYTLASAAALAELERPITATATSAMSASPESNFTESFTASVPLASAFLPTTTAEGRKNLLPPLPGGMKPGDLYIYLSSPQDAESLPVPLFRFSPNAHQPARAAPDLGTNPSDLTIATSTMSTHWV